VGRMIFLQEGSRNEKYKGDNYLVTIFFIDLLMTHPLCCLPCLPSSLPPSPPSLPPSLFSTGTPRFL